MRESTGRLGDRDRLGALERTLLLDSAPEAVFDRLSELVCDALSVPVAMLTLIDDTRQFFKSFVGLPEPLAKKSRP